MNTPDPDANVKRTYQFPRSMIESVQAVAAVEFISEAAAMRKMVALGYLVYTQRFATVSAATELAVKSVAGKDAA
jgi:hypothetical protein